MKCARCSAEIPSQSRFCLRCGAAVGEAARQPAPLGTPAAAPGSSTTPAAPAALTRPDPRRLWWIIGGLTLLCLALGAWIVRGTLLQKPGASGAAQLVQAPGESRPAELVQAPGDSRPSEMTQAAGEQEIVPPDVVAYLDFLKRIEASRQQLDRELESELKAMIVAIPLGNLQQFMNFEEEDAGHAGSREPAKRTSKKMNEIAHKWNELTALFHERVPPESCVELRDRYYEFLGKVQGQVMKVQSVVDQVFSSSQSPDALEPLLKEAYALQGIDKDADEATRRADQALADVCKRYRLRKDFDIRDGGSGVGGGFTGFGGMTP